MSNHIATGILTKGLIGGLRITGGLVTYTFGKGGRRTGGSSQDGSTYEQLKEDYLRSKDDIDYINVSICWADRPKNYGDKKIYVEFIKKTISADLMINETQINVELY